MAMLVGLSVSAQSAGHNIPEVTGDEVPVESDTLYVEEPVDSAALRDSLMWAERTEVYLQQLQRIATDAYATADDAVIDMNPYYYPLLTGSVLYRDPMHQALNVGWNKYRLGRDREYRLNTPVRDEELELLRIQNRYLIDMYVNNPALVRITQERLAEVGAPNAPKASKREQEKLSQQSAPVLGLDDDMDPVMVVTRRPNFWKVNGNGSLNFQQSYFSENWYQGGENNYSGLSQFTLNVNFDNKQKIQWDNRLEMQLGFQTSKGDTVRTFRPTSNMVRFTSKFGLKASKNWNYASKLEANTQIVRNHDMNSDRVTIDFLSPLNLNLSIGIDYKLNKKRFNSSLYLAPLSYNVKYCDRPNLATRNGIEEGHKAKHTFGPNVKFEFNWKLMKNVTWNSRTYWFSNFHMTNIEFENTVTFSVNKYLNTKLFIYPKFDDSAKRYHGEKHGYLMFKEWLSLGVSANF